MSIEKPRIPTPASEKASEALIHHNSIGELLSVGTDLETSPDKVYRSVRGEEAIQDLFASGVVRNAQSAGKVEKSRWGERIFWSRGAAGKYHTVQPDGYVIEAPYDVASQRVVTREDVTGIYKKDAEGKVVNVLESRP